MELQISRVAALMGEDARARMLIALMDGRALPASRLALAAQVSPQTTSAHLSKLVNGKLLVVEPQGKHRFSYNAGVVKYFFSTLLHPLRDERHFALVEISAIPTKARS